MLISVDALLSSFLRRFLIFASSSRLRHYAISLPLILPQLLVLLLHLIIFHTPMFSLCLMPLLPPFRLRYSELLRFAIRLCRHAFALPCYDADIITPPFDTLFAIKRPLIFFDVAIVVLLPIEDILLFLLMLYVAMPAC